MPPSEAEGHPLINGPRWQTASRVLQLSAILLWVFAMSQARCPNCRTASLNAVPLFAIIFQIVNYTRSRGLWAHKNFQDYRKRIPFLPSAPGSLILP